MKFALISNVLPPSETAHAAIIQRLLRDLDADSYCLLSSRDYTTGNQPTYSERLGGKYYYLPTPFRSILPERGLKGLRERLKGLIALGHRIVTIVRIIKREKCKAVIVCTGGHEVLDFPASFVASRLAGTSFYAYLLDQYSQMVSYIIGNSLLELVEPWILPRAQGVIAPNEFLSKELTARYKIKPVVIHNPCDLGMYQKNGLVDERVDIGGREIKIVYTGGLGRVHFDAFRNLLAAIESLGQKEVRLHLFIPQSKEASEKEGIRGRVVYHPHQPLSEMPTIQKGADILFLPLTFDSSYQDIVRTAAPGKMGEYLAARRPILVHAPPDSFIAWYFRQYECGFVVDQNDPARLADGLERMLSDTALCERLAARAWERAEADFALPKARKQFANLLGLQSG